MERVTFQFNIFESSSPKNIIFFPILVEIGRVIFEYKIFTIFISRQYIFTMWFFKSPFEEGVII